jgi:hypothetical protein
MTWTLDDVRALSEDEYTVLLEEVEKANKS